MFYVLCYFVIYFLCRKKAEVAMEGQFLVRQIYDDEITYNLIGAAVEILSKYFYRSYVKYCLNNFNVVSIMCKQ